MELSKRRILMDAFFKAQYNYCPTIWMFHSRCLNNKSNRLHERCFRMIYNDKISNFQALLNKDNSDSFHHNNIHALDIEMYKVANMLPDIMNGVFKLRNVPPRCNLPRTSYVSTDPIYSAYNGTESASYAGPKIWEQVPAEIQNKDFLGGFEKKKNYKIETSE